MYLSIITLNVNSLNAPIKRHRVGKRIRKQDPYILPPRDRSQMETYTQTKSKGTEKDISCKQIEKNAEVAVLTSDKIDFKTKAL